MLLINQILVEKESPDIKDLPIEKVLSFNYTNTYKKKYNEAECPMMIVAIFMGKLAKII